MPPTNEERRDKRKRRLALLAEYAEILRAWGLNVSQNLNKLMHHGAKKEWTTTQFVQQLRRTRDYKQQFVGIKWQEGMTESQYNAEYMAFLREADDLGKKLSRQDYGSILRSGMDFEEFQARTTVLRDLRDNPELKRMFEKVLHARGMLGPQKNLSKKNMWDIMTGTGDPRWEAAWQEAAITFQLQRIGLKTSQKKKLGFTRKDLLELIEYAEAGGIEVEQLGPDFYMQLSEKIRKLVPESRYSGLHISERDLLELELGGPRAPKIAARVDKIVKAIEAESQFQPQGTEFGAGKKLLPTPKAQVQ